MKVFVQVACEIDPTLNIRLLEGEPKAEAGDSLTRVSPTGRFAVDLATSLFGADITAFALGPDHGEALAYAIAAGAHRAIALGGDCHARGAITEWLRQESPEVVIAGPDVACAAARLGWAHLAGVQSMIAADGKLLVVRSLGRGDRERVEVRLPAALRPDEETGPRYVARSRLQAARERHFESLILTAPPRARQTELGPLRPARPRARLGAAAKAAPARASGRLQALMSLGATVMKTASTATPEGPVPTIEMQAESFVRYLAHHRLLETSHE